MMALIVKGGHVSLVLEYYNRLCQNIGYVYYSLNNYAKAVEYYEKEDKANLTPIGLLNFAHAYFQKKKNMLRHMRFLIIAAKDKRRYLPN